LPTYVPQNQRKDLASVELVSMTTVTYAMRTDFTIYLQKKKRLRCI